MYGSRIKAEESGAFTVTIDFRSWIPRQVEVRATPDETLEGFLLRVTPEINQTIQRANELTLNAQNALKVEWFATEHETSPRMELAQTFRSVGVTRGHVEKGFCWRLHARSAGACYCPLDAYETGG
jgi:hypothetical protein